IQADQPKAIGQPKPMNFQQAAPPPKTLGSKA
ncbi:hypothetical protein EVAR_71854_1, partial [Eumeta japonica]